MQGLSADPTPILTLTLEETFTLHAIICACIQNVLQHAATHVYAMHGITAARDNVCTLMLMTYMMEDSDGLLVVASF